MQNHDFRVGYQFSKPKFKIRRWSCQPYLFESKVQNIKVVRKLQLFSKNQVQNKKVAGKSMIFKVEYQVLGAGSFSTAPFPRPTITKLFFFAEIAIESSNALEHELSRRCRASDRNHYPQPVPALVSLQHSLYSAP